LATLLRLTSPLTNLFSGSRVLALDKDSAGALSRILYAIGGRTWAGLEQRTLTYTPTGGAQTTSETVALRAYPDGTTPVDALLVDLTTGGGDLRKASATMVAGTTVDLGSAPVGKVAITGSAAIVSFGVGRHLERLVHVVDGGATLTHNATSLVLPGGANIVTAAGDCFHATSDAAGNWRVRSYGRASGKPVIGLAAADVTDASASGRTVLTGTAAQGATALGLGAGDSPTHTSLTLNRNATATASLPAAPSGSAMRLVGANGALSVISAEAYGGQAFFTLRRAGGTAASPSALAPGDAMGLFGSGGYVVGSGFADYTGRLNFTATEAFTATAQGTAISLSACKRGTTAQSTMVSFDPDNGASFTGAVSVAAALQVTGGAQFGGYVGLPSFTVATLPAGGAGRMVFVSNARKLGEAAGSGTGVAAYHSNSNWRRLSDDSPVAA
ncbi:hypothetical protein, partial [Methylobacterium tarhaniae]|uniref:hypothetical protein n=1 Tax=Methylobacterium tarhaniae TaxID=1187852 RepID=UPI003CFFEF5E